MPICRPNSKPANHLRLVNALSRRAVTCAAENPAFSRFADRRELPKRAKRGAAGNHVSIPAVLVDIVEFNQIAKEQVAHGAYGSHATMYRRSSRPNVSRKTANWTIFHKIVASRCGTVTCDRIKTADFAEGPLFPRSAWEHTALTLRVRW